jgi:hypothetical protein
MTLGKTSLKGYLRGLKLYKGVSMTKVFKAKKNTAFKDKDAVIIGRFLEKHFPNEEYDTAKIVELAKPKRSPIHKYFEWDDTVAAQRYRIQQARKMITSLVVIVDEQEAPAAVSVVVRDGNKSHRTYMDTFKACEQEDLREQVLQDAIKSLQGWEWRYQTLKGLKPLKGVFKEIEKLTPKEA